MYLFTYLICIWGWTRTNINNQVGLLSPVISSCQPHVETPSNRRPPFDFTIFSKFIRLLPTSPPQTLWTVYVSIHLKYTRYTRIQAPVSARVQKTMHIYMHTYITASYSIFVYARTRQFQPSFAFLHAPRYAMRVYIIP